MKLEFLVSNVFLIRAAAVGHGGLIVAGLLMPRVTGLWDQVRSLDPFARGLFRLYYAFIALCLVGFGGGTGLLAEELAEGTLLARAVCGFLSVFWLLRLAGAIFLLDVRPYLSSPARRLGYHCLNVVFATFPLLYGWLALR